jgi:hypothetical protein
VTEIDNNSLLRQSLETHILVEVVVKAKLNVDDFLLFRELGLLDIVHMFAMSLAEKLETQDERWAVPEMHVVLEARYETGRKFLKVDGFGNPILIHCRLVDEESCAVVFSVCALIYRKSYEVVVGVIFEQKPVSEVKGTPRSVATVLVESVVNALFPPPKA